MFSMSLLFTRLIAMCSGMIFEVLMITAFNMRTIDNYLIYLSPFSWSDLSIFGRKYDGMEYFNGTPTMGWCVGILLLLIWLYFGEVGLENEELEDLIINKSGLWLDSGAIFGEDGKGYQRINIACTRKTLEQALNQLKSGIDSLK